MTKKAQFWRALPLALLACWPIACWPRSAIAAGGACVALGESGGREALINRCNACQIVGLKHKRPGGEPAIHRSYPVPANSSIDLSFRGPGQSQITSVSPCRPEVQESQKSQADGEKCAHLQRTLDGGLVIINACNGCLEAEAELTGEGNFKAKEAFTLAGKAYLPVDTKGASQVRILSERKCR